MMMMSPSNEQLPELAVTEQAISRYIRQHLMSLYEAHLQQGMKQDEARHNVAGFVRSLFEDWPAGQAIRPVLLRPLVDQAIALARPLGPEAEALRRKLIDLKNASGG